MNKNLLLLGMVGALGLVGCGGGNNGGGTNTPDPTTLTFTASGTADWTPPSSVTLKDTFLSNGNTITIGTYGTDKSVKLSITPAQVEQAGSANEASFKGSFGSSCNSSGLSVYSGFNYYRFRATDVFTINGDSSYLRPRTITQNTDGTRNYVDRQFIYVKTGGTISGTVTCPDGNISVNLVLKPGWNIAQESYTYNPTTKMYSNDTMTVASYSNTDTGPWIAYDAN